MLKYLISFVSTLCISILLLAISTSHFMSGFAAYMIFLVPLSFIGCLLGEILFSLKREKLYGYGWELNIFFLSVFYMV